MIKFDIKNLVPRFIMQDKNGRALAKAIEKALNIMCGAMQEGLDNLSNIDKMPEWRLDELAWEYNSVYDYDADIEQKREWIADAAPIYRIYGTARAIYDYLRRKYNGIDIDEWWVYGADPYHFRVTIEGEGDPIEEQDDISGVIKRIKNVRSVYDGIMYVTKVEGAAIYAGAALRTTTIHKMGLEV